MSSPPSAKEESVPLRRSTRKSVTAKKEELVLTPRKTKTRSTPVKNAPIIEKAPATPGTPRRGRQPKLLAEGPSTPSRRNLSNIVEEVTPSKRGRPSKGVSTPKKSDKENVILPENIQKEEKATPRKSRAKEKTKKLNDIEEELVKNLEETAMTKSLHTSPISSYATQRIEITKEEELAEKKRTIADSPELEMKKSSKKSVHFSETVDKIILAEELGTSSVGIAETLSTSKNNKNIILVPTSPTPVVCHETTQQEDEKETKQFQSLLDENRKLLSEENNEIVRNELDKPNVNIPFNSKKNNFDLESTLMSPGDFLKSDESLNEEKTGNEYVDNKPEEENSSLITDILKSDTNVIGSLSNESIDSPNKNVNSSSRRGQTTENTQPIVDTCNPEKKDELPTVSTVLTHTNSSLESDLNDKSPNEKIPEIVKERDGECCQNESPKILGVPQELYVGINKNAKLEEEYSHVHIKLENTAVFQELCNKQTLSLRSYACEEIKEKYKENSPRKKVSIPKKLFDNLCDSPLPTKIEKQSPVKKILLDHISVDKVGCLDMLPLDRKEYQEEKKVMLSKLDETISHGVDTKKLLSDELESKRNSLELVNLVDHFDAKNLTPLKMLKSPTKRNSTENDVCSIVEEITSETKSPKRRKPITLMGTFKSSENKKGVLVSSIQVDSPELIKTADSLSNNDVTNQSISAGIPIENLSTEPSPREPDAEESLILEEGGNSVGTEENSVDEKNIFQSELILNRDDEKSFQGVSPHTNISPELHVDSNLLLNNNSQEETVSDKNNAKRKLLEAHEPFESEGVNVLTLSSERKKSEKLVSSSQEDKVSSFIKPGISENGNEKMYVISKSPMKLKSVKIVLNEELSCSETLVSSAKLKSNEKTRNSIEILITDGIQLEQVSLNTRDHFSKVYPDARLTSKMFPEDKTNLFENRASIAESKILEKKNVSIDRMGIVENEENSEHGNTKTLMEDISLHTKQLVENVNALKVKLEKQSPRKCNSSGENMFVGKLFKQEAPSNYDINDFDKEKDNLCTAQSEDCRNSSPNVTSTVDIIEEGAMNNHKEDECYIRKVNSPENILDKHEEICLTSVDKTIQCLKSDLSNDTKLEIVGLQEHSEAVDKSVLISSINGLFEKQSEEIKNITTETEVKDTKVGCLPYKKAYKRIKVNEDIDSSSETDSNAVDNESSEPNCLEVNKIKNSSEPQYLCSENICLQPESLREKQLSESECDLEEKDNKICEYFLDLEAEENEETCDSDSQEYKNSDYQESTVSSVISASEFFLETEATDEFCPENEMMKEITFNDWIRGRTHSSSDKSSSPTSNERDLEEAHISENELQNQKGTLTKIDDWKLDEMNHELTSNTSKESQKQVLANSNLVKPTSELQTNQGVFSVTELSKQMLTIGDIKSKKIQTAQGAFLVSDDLETNPSESLLEKQRIKLNVRGKECKIPTEEVFLVSNMTNENKLYNNVTKKSRENKPQPNKTNLNSDTKRPVPKGKHPDTISQKKIKSGIPVKQTSGGAFCWGGNDSRLSETSTSIENHKHVFRSDCSVVGERSQYRSTAVLPTCMEIKDIKKALTTAGIDGVESIAIVNNRVATIDFRNAESFKKAMSLYGVVKFRGDPVYILASSTLP